MHILSLKICECVCSSSPTAQRVKWADERRMIKGWMYLRAPCLNKHYGFKNQFSAGNLCCCDRLGRVMSTVMEPHISLFISPDSGLEFIMKNNDTVSDIAWITTLIYDSS